MWLPVAALVLLRLAVGFHFFSEGAHKFEFDEAKNEWRISPSFVAANQGFLRAATGPWAEFYHNQLPTTHEWRKHLVVAKEMKPADYEKLDRWVAGYVQRRQRELSTGKPTEPQFVDYAPAASWAEAILADWEKSEAKFNAIRILDQSQREAGAEVFAKHRLNLADFVAEEALEMQAYQHELWRLANKQAKPGANEVPFMQERVAQQESQTSGTPRRWVATVQELDSYLADDLAAVLTEEQRETPVNDRVRKLATDPQIVTQERNTWLVAIGITAIGFCLMIGFFTPVAAILGALFLLTVMASQPPWVEGARTDYFYYQLSEFTALLLLAAACAGKYAGIDAFIHRWWSKPRPRQGA